MEIMEIIYNENGQIKIRSGNFVCCIIESHTSDPQCKGALIIQAEEIILIKGEEKTVPSCISVLPRANNSILVKATR